MTTTTMPNWAHRLVLPAILIVLAAVGLLAQGKLKWGSLAKPGPAMWPTVTAVLVLVTAVALLVFDRQSVAIAEAGRPRMALAAIGSLLVFPGFLWLLGFGPTAALMLLVWLRLFAQQPWRRAIVTAVVGAVVCWAVFGLLLGVPFPQPLLLGGGE